MKLFDRNFLVRTLSGALLVAVVVGAALLSRWTFFALLLVVMAGSTVEFHRLARAGGLHPQRRYTLVVSVLFVALNMGVATGEVHPVFLLLMLPPLTAIPVVELYRHSERPTADIGASYMSLIYIALPIALLCYLPFMGHGDGSEFEAGRYNGQLFLYYIFILWANDVGAYIFGVLLGRHRIFERHSPKKSWEGFFGGLILATTLGAWIGGPLLKHSMVSGAIFGIIVSVTGLYGDLVESMLKRAAGVKDSGAIMPGHGGFLDRFDAMLVSAPFVFVFYVIFFMR
ncbi:MAG: phosphatidate cytidylyltransferase [Rikenellaceae bacterium]|jgi:phosphatidate cytidylyltransferase|nr:phosphatidate cytidylyltransferase [Rikenellaceae bacterium]